VAVTPIRNKFLVLRELTAAQRTGDSGAYDRLLEEYKGLLERRDPFERTPSGALRLQSGWPFPSAYRPAFEQLLQLAGANPPEEVEKWVRHSAWCARRLPTGVIERNRRTKLLRPRFSRCRNAYCIDTIPERIVEHRELEFSDVLGAATRTARVDRLYYLDQLEDPEVKAELARGPSLSTLHCWVVRLGVGLPGHTSPERLVSVDRDYSRSRNTGKGKGGLHLNRWLERSDSGREPLVRGPWVGESHLSLGHLRPTGSPPPFLASAKVPHGPGLTWWVLAAVDGSKGGELDAQRLLDRWVNLPRHPKGSQPWVEVWSLGAELRGAWEAVNLGWAEDFWADAADAHLKKDAARKLHALAEDSHLTFHGHLGDLYGKVDELKGQARKERSVARGEEQADQWEVVSKIEDLNAASQEEVRRFVQEENSHTLARRAQIDSRGRAVAPSKKGGDDVTEQRFREILREENASLKQELVAAFEQLVERLRRGEISAEEFDRRSRTVLASRKLQ
jgi:hypothetical protein